jgi:hypothetical protein
VRNQNAKKIIIKRFSLNLKNNFKLPKILMKLKITFGNTEIAKKNLEGVVNENKSLILTSNNLIKKLWL